MINILMNKKTRTHRMSKLPDDGDPWAPNNLLTSEQKKNTSWTPVGQATDKKLWPQPTKINSHHRVWCPTHRRAIKEGSILINQDWVKN